jgi:hypothetical protein
MSLWGTFKIQTVNNPSSPNQEDDKVSILGTYDSVRLHNKGELRLLLGQLTLK